MNSYTAPRSTRAADSLLRRYSFGEANTSSIILLLPLPSLNEQIGRIDPQAYKVSTM